MASRDDNVMLIANTSFRESLNCSICLDTLKSPKALSCLHTFCEECIQSIIDSTSGRQKSIVCPECRQKTTPPRNVDMADWAKSLPTNWPLVRFIDRLERTQATTLENIPESNEDDSGQLSSNHQYLEECQQIEMCLLHSGDKMTLYCVEHSAMFCEKCKNDVHRWGCTVVPIESRASDMAIASNASNIEKQYQDINKRLDKTKDAMEGNITDVKDKIANFQTRMFNIRGEIDKLLNEMQQTISSAEFRDENIKKFCECQNSKMTECDDLKAAMTYSRSDMDTVLHHGTPTQRFIATEQLLRLMPLFEQAAADKEKSAVRVEVRHEGIGILNSILQMKDHMLNVDGLHVKLEK